MSRRFGKKIKSRRGYLILVLSVTLLTFSLSNALVVYKSAYAEVYRVKQTAEQVQMRYAAQSGLSLVLLLIDKFSTKELYGRGIIGLPFGPITFKDVTYTVTVTEESGKLNLNSLVNFFDDGVNLSTRQMFERLGENFGVPVENWDAVVDWIDENSQAMPHGYEAPYYASLDPPARIKNSRMHSVEELLFIEGFDNFMLFNDNRTKEEKEMYSEEFLSAAEQGAIREDIDYILANNLTVFIPEDGPDDLFKVNLNSAPYHVILALSAFMTPQMARKIITQRTENGSYFSNTEELKKIPELMQTVGDVSIFDEIKEKIVIRDRIYKIVVKAIQGQKAASVMGIYDVMTKKIILYLE